MKNDSIPTGVPLKDPDDIYLSFILDQIRKLTEILTNHSKSFHEAELSCYVLIASIADKERKREIRRIFTNQLMKIKRVDGLTNDERINLIEICCAEVIDSVIDYLDELLGMVTQNVISDIAGERPK